MATATKLREARERIANIGWTQGTFARDSAGKPVDPDSPDAACFCLYGAFLTKAVNRQYPAEVRLLTRAVGYDLLSLWNDSLERKKEDVLAAFDKAIALEDAA